MLIFMPFLFSAFFKIGMHNSLNVPGLKSHIFRTEIIEINFLRVGVGQNPSGRLRPRLQMIMIMIGNNSRLMHLHRNWLIFNQTCIDMRIRIGVAMAMKGNLLTILA